jgi:hypothetical protein
MRKNEKGGGNDDASTGVSRTEIIGCQVGHILWSNLTQTTEYVYQRTSPRADSDSTFVLLRPMRLQGSTVFTPRILIRVDYSWGVKY